MISFEDVLSFDLILPSIASCISVQLSYIQQYCKKSFIQSTFVSRVIKTVVFMYIAQIRKTRYFSRKQVNFGENFLHLLKESSSHSNIYFRCKYDVQNMTECVDRAEIPKLHFSTPKFPKFYLKILFQPSNQSVTSQRIIGSNMTV